MTKNICADFYNLENNIRIALNEEWHHIMMEYEYLVPIIRKIVKEEINNELNKVEAPVLRITPDMDAAAVEVELDIFRKEIIMSDNAEIRGDIIQKRNKIMRENNGNGDLRRFPTFLL